MSGCQHTLVGSLSKAFKKGHSWARQSCLAVHMFILGMQYLYLGVPVCVCLGMDVRYAYSSLVWLLVLHFGDRNRRYLSTRLWRESHRRFHGSWAHPASTTRPWSSLKKTNKKPWRTRRACEKYSWSLQPKQGCLSVSKQHPCHFQAHLKRMTLGVEFCRFPPFFGTFDVWTYECR